MWPLWAKVTVAVVVFLLLTIALSALYSSDAFSRYEKSKWYGSPAILLGTVGLACFAVIDLSGYQHPTVLRVILLLSCAVGVLEGVITWRRRSCREKGR